MQICKDREALWDLSYGVYIVTTKALSENTNDTGLVINTAFQVTAEPPQIAICVSKDNYSYECLRKNGVFGVSTLDSDAPMTFIGKWGFKSSRDINKFDNTKYKIGEKTGVPLVLDYALSIFEAKIVRETDVGTHSIFVGEVISSEVLKEGHALTYEIYQKEKKGKAPKNAPTYKG
jgi:ferric-chelate reductase [NAD(P)H]